MGVHTLLDAKDRASVMDRIGRLSPDMAPRWGRMTAAQMTRHCVEALRGSLGDVHHRSVGRRLFQTRLVKYLVIRVLPFPKGAPTVPELRMTDEADLEVERARLVALVGRYGLPPERDADAEHPLFGVLTHEEWAELEYRHVDHHLRQFGV